MCVIRQCVIASIVTSSACRSRAHILWYHIEAHSSNDRSGSPVSCWTKDLLRLSAFQYGTTRVVCRCCRGAEDRDSLPSNTGTILKHISPG
jgi:hypothetical protein